MFLSVCVTVALGRRLVPWTIIELQHTEDRTFQYLFSEVKAGRFDCVQVVDELKHATLMQVLGGSGREEKLMVTSANQSVLMFAKRLGTM